MTELTCSEVRRWDASAIEQVFQVVKNRDGTVKEFGDTIGSAQQELNDWGGEAGDSFHQEAQHKRQYLENDQLAPQLQAAVERAETDAKACRDEMDSIDQVAAQHHWNVFDNWFLDYSPNPNDVDLINQTEQRLAALQKKADTADHELAVAIRAAAGDAQLDDQGQEGNGQPGTTTPTSSPGTQERPGVTDVNDPNVKWQPGFDPTTWQNSWHDPQLADNPPGYTGGPGPERDAAWQNYLANFPKDGRGFLPNPNAVSDPGLKVVGNGATQLGTSYAWGGKGLNGPGKGTLNDDPPDGGAHVYGDDQRTGFDCSGLAEYSVYQSTHADIGAGTGTQIGSANLAPVDGPLKPGDLVYYGSGGAHHVGIYVAPGVILNAPESGLPVELDHRSTTPGSDSGELVRARRPS